MPDYDRVIHQYNRDNWTLKDLRDIVAAHAEHHDGAAVALTCPANRSRRGTIEVFE